MPAIKKSLSTFIIFFTKLQFFILYIQYKLVHKINYSVIINFANKNITMINAEIISKWREDILNNLNSDDFNILLEKIEKQNPTFIPKFVNTAINNIFEALEPSKYEKWIKNYNIPKEEKTLGIVCAGNIPAVGFFDIFMGLVSNHKVYVKLSHSDSILIPYLFEQLFKIVPSLKDKILYVDSIHNVKADKIIATGSNNANRYFMQYFTNKKALLRHDRKSLAIINDDTTDEELNQLADDIFLYFGLGCRNVSLILLPRSFSLDKLQTAFKNYSWILDNLYYQEIYTYYQAYFSLMNEKYTTNEFYILRERLDLYAPISTINYEYYDSPSEVEEFIKINKENIQCIVGDNRFCNTKFGKTQIPELDDYADGEDVMSFLTE
jgi:hypothetical protein